MSMFFFPSMIVSKRNKSMNIMVWQRRCGLLKRCLIFKTMKAM